MAPETKNNVMPINGDTQWPGHADLEVGKCLSSGMKLCHSPEIDFAAELAPVAKLYKYQHLLRDCRHDHSVVQGYQVSPADYSLKYRTSFPVDNQGIGIQLSTLISGNFDDSELYSSKSSVMAESMGTLKVVCSVGLISLPEFPYGLPSAEYTLPARCPHGSVTFGRVITWAAQCVVQHTLKTTGLPDFSFLNTLRLMKMLLDIPRGDSSYITVYPVLTRCSPGRVRG
ncbi:hypothetical protein HGRIS_003306 [Hohenbuehelia grisea]|uniref:Uncharacterized protein n=1 Tax=Hohenbuehelia grisea TaxID=104357 RepID=A0ABR3JFL9_9AGAR